MRFIPWSETSQAKYDLRRALGDLGHDLESGLFCIVDINYRPPTFPTYFCNRKGYLRLNAHNDVIQVKRAYYAIQNMMSVFNARVTRVKEPRVSSSDPSLSLFEYATQAGEPLFVFWQLVRKLFSPVTVSESDGGVIVSNRFDFVSLAGWTLRWNGGGVVRAFVAHQHRYP